MVYSEEITSIRISDAIHVWHKPMSL